MIDGDSYGNDYNDGMKVFNINRNLFVLVIFLEKEYRTCDKEELFFF